MYAVLGDNVQFCIGILDLHIFFLLMLHYWDVEFCFEEFKRCDAKNKDEKGKLVLVGN